MDKSKWLLLASVSCILFCVLSNAYGISSEWLSKGKSAASIKNVHGDTFSIKCSAGKCSAKLNLQRQCVKNKFTIQLLVDNQKIGKRILASGIKGSRACTEGQLLNTRGMNVDFAGPIPKEQLSALKRGMVLKFAYTIDGGVESYTYFTLSGSMEAISSIDSSQTSGTNIKKKNSISKKNGLIQRNTSEANCIPFKKYNLDNASFNGAVFCPSIEQPEANRRFINVFCDKNGFSITYLVEKPYSDRTEFIVQFDSNIPFTVTGNLTENGAYVLADIVIGEQINSANPYDMINALKKSNFIKTTTYYENKQIHDVFNLNGFTDSYRESCSKSPYYRRRSKN